MNGVLIDGVPKFLAPIPSKTKHIIELQNPFDVTHLITIPLKLNRVTGYFEVRTLTQEKYEDQNILKIELASEAPPLDSPDFSHQEQRMFDNRG